MTLVPYEELENSPNVTYNRRGGSAVRKVRIDWGNIDAFLTEIFPYNPNWAFLPGFPWLVVTEASIAPFDPARPNGMYEEINTYPTGALVTVNYTVSPMLGYMQDVAYGGEGSGPGGSHGSSGGSSQTTLLSHKVSLGGEYLNLPGLGLAWATAADRSGPYIPADVVGPLFRVTEEVHVGVIVPTIEHSITWHQVLWPNWPGFRKCIGCVNQYTFAGAPPETLMFLGVEGSREIGNTGQSNWTLTFKFSEKNTSPQSTTPTGWNCFFRPDAQAAGGSWQLMVRKNGDPIFPLVDFGNLIFVYGPSGGSLLSGREHLHASRTQYRRTAQRASRHVRTRGRRQLDAILSHSQRWAPSRN
jgi:hypothetical protein